MERKEHAPEPNKPVDPAVIAIIVRWQIIEIMKEIDRREFVNNMNA